MKDNNLKSKQKHKFLKELKHCRFQVGYYDKNRKKIYSEIKNFKSFDKSFLIKNKNCYYIIEDKSSHLGVHFIVLKESELYNALKKLRIKIVGYLILSFIFMGIIGYFLGRLFLRPVREQIESLDRFISDTTHELNTPISAILMTIQSIKGIESKKMRRLEASAKRLSTMYSSLTYRLEGNIEPAENILFNKIIEERVEYVKELIESKKLNLIIDLEDTEVYISKIGAYRLIDNLISNAIKYSDIEGKISISIKDNILKVIDSGIGIDEKIQSDIFKRYLRANDERGGFGIGLNIVLSICKKYGIKLDLESKKGKGSIFILTFPYIKQKKEN